MMMLRGTVYKYSVPLQAFSVLCALILGKADHICHGSGRFGDPAMFEDLVVPCRPAPDRMVVAQYSLRLPVALELLSNVSTNVYVHATHGSDNSTDGLSI